VYLHDRQAENPGGIAMDAGRYTAFDARLAQISGTPWKHERGPGATRELVSRCMAAVQALPQADAIPEDRATRWILKTTQAEAGRVRGTGGEITMPALHAAVSWHLRRATGIGGSDAGAVLAESRGQAPTFTTARNLAAEKLLILPPQPATGPMMRGIRAEPWLQRMYLEQTGRSSASTGLGALRNARDPDAPWRIGTPDDFVHLVHVEESPDGAWHMIDYKCPGPDVFAEMRKDISLDYTCQLHHYHAIARRAGVRVDTMAIAAFDAENFLVEEFPVTHDPALARELEQACAGFWQLVEAGTLPEPRSGPGPLEPSPEATDTLARITLMRAVADEITTRVAGIRDRLEQQYLDQRGELRIPAAAWTIADRWDEDQLRTLADLGEVDPARHEKVTRKPDPAACVATLSEIYAALEGGEDPADILEALRESGVPLSRTLDADSLAAALADEGIDTAVARGAVTRHRISTRTADQEVVQAVRAEAAGMVDEIEAVSLEILDVALAREPDHDHSATEAAEPAEAFAPAA